MEELALQIIESLPNVVFKVKTKQPKQSEEEGGMLQQSPTETGSATATPEIDSQIQSA